MTGGHLLALLRQPRHRADARETAALSNRQQLERSALVVIFCCILGGSGGLAEQEFLSVKEPDRTPTPQAAHHDFHGDPLPPESIARLGTTRFRHGANIIEIAFNPDGTRLISADCYGARLWDAASGREIRRLGPRFQTSLRSLSLSPDGKTVALAEHHGGTIQIWDTANGKLLRQFKNGSDNADRFCYATFSPDGKLLASDAGKIIRLWDAATGKKLHQWQADPQQVHRILFTPDCKTLISGGEDKTIRFWDTSTGKEVRRITDHPGPVTGLALSADGKMLATQGSTRHERNLPGGGRGTLWLTDNKVHLWDAASGKKLRQLEALGPASKQPRIYGSHPNAIHHLCFAPDGKTLVTVGQDRTIRIWDAGEGKELRRWVMPWVTSLAFTRDGKTLATGGIDCTIRLWDWKTGRELREQPGHRGGVQFLALSPDGRRIATSSMDRTVRIWDAGSGRELLRLGGREGEMAPVAFSADGRTLTTVGREMTAGGADKKGRIWDVATGKELRQLPDWPECSSYAVSADGQTYAFVPESKQVWLWDAAAQRKRAVRIEHAKGVSSLVFSADARALLGWCGDGKVHVWDTVTGKELRQFAAGDSGEWNGIAFSPDGRWLAWVNRDSEIRLYDLDTGKEVRRCRGSSRFISCLAFAPDGRTLASASMSDPVIYLWETASGRVRHRLTGHQGRIFKLLFSADSKRLLSGSEDTTALLWDLIGGRGEYIRVKTVNIPARWDDLMSEDAETACQAQRILIATAGPTVDFLRKQLQPVPVPDPKRIAGLIADLDHDEFARRANAVRELEKMGDAIELTLRAAGTDAKSAEIRRRIEALLAKLPDTERRTPSAARLRMLRAIEVLERIGTAGARELLRKLADGAAGARQTHEAKAALRRLTSRSLPSR